MYTLRTATQEDERAIVALVRVTEINPMGIKWPRFVVAIDDATQSVVGIGQIKPHNDGSRELASIATDEAHRHRGIAHKIINHLLERYTGTLYLTCQDYHEPLYQQFGFRTVGTGEMTPYFRRLSRLVKALLRFDKSQRKMLVMRRNPSETA